MAINLLADEQTTPINLLSEDKSSPETVDTFIGRVPRHPSEFKSGTPENKALMDELISGFAGMPGLNVLGQTAAKMGNALLNTGKTAFKNIDPYTEAVQKATEEHGAISQSELEHENLLKKALDEHAAASEENTPVKPGLFQNPTREVENVENEIGKHINAEGQHDVRAARAINNRVNSVEGFWNDSYKNFENKIKDSEFHMPEQAMGNINYDMNAIMQKIKEGANPKTVIKDMEKEAEANQNPYYKQLISKAPTAKDTNAATFLSKYRDFRDSLGGLKQDLKSDRYGSMEKEKISDAIQNAKEVETQIKQTLHEGLGEFKPEYDWLMKGYSEQVYPLRDNPIVAAAKKGKLSTNIIKDLRTNESGMPLVREMVKQDPELLRNVVGQRYMKDPSEIYNPNELMREYLDEMPGFKNLLKQKESVLQKTANQKNISLQQKMQIEKELSEIKKSKLKAKQNISNKEYELNKAKSAKSKAQKSIKYAGLTSLILPFGYGAKYAGSALSNLLTGGEK
jgi:hypothetical protein